MLEVYVEPGEEIEIEPGRPIAALGEPSERPPPASEVSFADTTTVGSTRTAAGAPARPPQTEGGTGATETDPPDAAAEGVTSTDAKLTKISPRARRAAAETDAPIDLTAIRGTGPEESIVEDDVLTHLEETRDIYIGGETGISGQEVRATPSARRLARRSDVDRDSVWESTGDIGTITTTEVRVQIKGARSGSTNGTSGTHETGTPARAQSAPGLTVGETRTLSGTRQRIAERMSASAREKPHVMGTGEISIEHLRRVQERLADHNVDSSISDPIFIPLGRYCRTYQRSTRTLWTTSICSPRRSTSATPLTDRAGLSSRS